MMRNESSTRSAARRSASRRNRFLFDALLLVALLVGGTVLVRIYADRAFYVPDTNASRPPDHPDYTVEEVWVPSGDGRLAAWVLEPRGLVGDELKGTVLFSHGNGGNLAGNLSFCDFLPSGGYRTVAFDYRGYGPSSPLSPSRGSTVEDLHAALDFVSERYEKPWLMGHSLGASLAVWVGGERSEEVRGVVAVAPFASYRAIARDVLRGSFLPESIAWPLGFFVADGHDPEDAVARISPKPILFVHGKRDRTIPYRMSRELHDLAGRPKDLLLLPEASHGSRWRNMGEEYCPKIFAFLSSS